MNPFANASGTWALAAFPALLLLALASRYVARRREKAWGGNANIRALADLPAREWDFLRASCLWVALGLCFLAFARPQWGEVVENVQKVGLDVVILLDTSRSMAVTDVPPSRLERAKLEVRSFLSTDEGDRVGLAAFAGVPLRLSPLTEDTGAISLLLDIADEDLIPAQGTEVGKGIAEALRILPQPHDRDQVILLFSDGEDQGSSAIAAARTAARLGVRLFCIGVGTAAGGPVLGPGGRQMEDPVTHAPARSRLDEGTMNQMAAISDGRYWALAGAGSVVPQIVDELGHLKRKEYASRARAQREDQFPWFLIPALLLSVVAALLPERRRALPPAAAPVADRTRKGTALPAGLLALAVLLVPAAARAQSVTDLGQSARAAYASGQFDRALSLYQRALQVSTSPKVKPLLHFNTGTCLLALGRLPEAQDELTLGLAGADPLVRGRTLYNLAHVFQREGQRERALAALRTLLASDPQDRDAKLLYEWILRQKPPEPPPPDQPPPPEPKVKPPDVLEQLPMPPPRELQDQVRPPDTSTPGMKPW